MKVTRAKLKQIIKEELQVVLTNEEVEEMFGEDVRAQVEESEQDRDREKVVYAQSVAGQQMSFERWVAVVFNKGYEIDDKSPNPYDAWMSGQTPEEYASMQEGLFGGKFGNKKEIPAKNKPRERTDAEKEKLDRFYQAVNKKMEEKKLSKPEKKEKERVVEGIKKSKKDFKQRYGDDAEGVMYATATKIAKDK
jgi:hypothetical protein